MAFRGPLEGLGSTTALSLAANPAALPVIAIGAGVAVTIGAAKWTYDAYNDYKKEKHLAEIEDVNKLHRTYLEKIIIFETHEIQGFPAVFKFTEKKSEADPDKVECIRFTDEDVEKMGETMPRGMDVSLTKYREHILDAILKLKDYYLTHVRKDKEKKKDVTSAVLAYLLYMLETKCLNFSGYEYDIAYLGALEGFINAYASLKGKLNTEHFSRLDPVRSSLLSAKQELEKHQQMMTLKDMVCELSSHCVSQSKKMIKTLARLIVEEDKWEHIKTATFAEMTSGIVRKKYIRSPWMGFIPRKDPKIEIPDSLFKDWLVWLLKYFEESINPDSPMTSDDILPPDDIFALPNLDLLTQDHKKIKSKKLRKQIKETKAELDSIRAHFARCKNFITTKLDPATANEETPNFVRVHEDKELIERAKVIASIATVTHQVISLQYLCVHLLKSLKQLGEIYVKSPRHFSLVFVVLEEMCRTIQSDVTKTKNAITAIQQGNANKGQLAPQEQFPEDTKKLLTTIDVTVSKLSKRVSDYRDKVSKDKNFIARAFESVKHEMFEVAGLFVRIFRIDHDLVATPAADVTPDDTPQPSLRHIHGTFPAGRISSVEKPSLKAAIEANSFWNRHKYKILGGIAIASGVVMMLGAVAISAFSGGALSPVGAIVAAAGVKIGIAGAALAGVDALVGLAAGLLTGSLVNGAILAGKAVQKRFSSSQKMIIERLNAPAKQPEASPVLITTPPPSTPVTVTSPASKPHLHHHRRRKHNPLAAGGESHAPRLVVG